MEKEKLVLQQREGRVGKRKELTEGVALPRSTGKSSSVNISR